MNITQPTSTRLVLESLSFRKIWATGGSIILFGFILILALGKFNYLKCDRSSSQPANCQIWEIGLLPKFNQFQIRHTIKGDAQNPQIIVLLVNNPLSIILSDSTTGIFQRNPQQLNSMLYRAVSPLQTLFPKDSVSLNTIVWNEEGNLALGSGLVSILVGTIFLISQKMQTCILDEEQNQMIYTQQRIGRKAKITTTSLTGIQVLVEKDKDTDEDTIYTLFLQPCHSERVKITRSAGPHASQMAISLAQFLNIEVTRVDLTKQDSET